MYQTTNAEQPKHHKKAYQAGVQAFLEDDPFTVPYTMTTEWERDSWTAGYRAEAEAHNVDPEDRVFLACN